ncbi:hypothetical protein FBU59_002905 [Linderina macrospora]|uniref:Uncharacterized protein n=1 Tax=Linderina macrospora TaxID=4868 RepID=A0ACC1JA57_9FUNG|nr:hypothetical protein FBU59_002905 [Linderina macrospora]
MSDAKFTAGDRMSRTDVLTSNHAFDSQGIAPSVGLKQGKRGRSRRTAMLPDITLRRVFFITLWLLLQAIVMGYRWAKVSKKGGHLNGFADGTMCCLMFSFAMIFIFMSPTLLELLRRTFISRHISIEKNIHAHKIASYSVAIWGIAHVATFYYKFNLTAKKSGGKVSLGTKLFGSRLGVTGHLLWFSFFFIYVTSAPLVRRRFHEVFYYTHHLFLAIVPLLFLHGSAASFQWYFVAPGSIYVLDRMYRLMRSRFRHPKILSVIQHPSNVIELRIEKRGISAQVGQYVYLNVPSISYLQWHPFTLTSAPEEDELTLHIWVSGDWTKRLVTALRACAINDVNDSSSLFNMGSRPATAASAPSSVASTSITERLERARNVPTDPGNLNTLSTLADQERLMLMMKGEIDPASGLPKPGVKTTYNPLNHHRGSTDSRPWSRVGRNSQVLLDRLPPEMDFRLSGTQAFAPVPNPTVQNAPLINLPRILVDGPYGAPTQQVFDYGCVVLVGGGIGVTPMASVLKSLYYQLLSPPRMRRVQKVYFLWVCRDVQSLEWFQDLLAALDEEDIGDTLEIRTYLTGQMPVDKINNIALYHDSDAADPITGLVQSPTYFGRPNFDNIFNDIGRRNPGTDVGVFFCGPKLMGRSLRRTANHWTKELRSIKTKFIFHKENF